MLSIIRDRVQSGIDAGKSLVEIKRGRPALDYAGVFGATSGPWTTDDFIEAVYRSLGGRR